MMIEVTEDMLCAMVDAVVRAVDPEEVILFGSRGRGQGSGQSDVDLLVVEEEDFGGSPSRWDQLQQIREALWGFRVPVDVLLFSRAEVEHWRDSLNHVVARALREGKRLYARP